MSKENFENDIGKLQKELSEERREILDLLEQKWEQNPDWRLCQLICNMAGKVRDEYYNDPFYCSDANLKETLLRDKALDNLVEQAQELGLYDKEEE